MSDKHLVPNEYLDNLFSPCHFLLRVESADLKKSSFIKASIHSNTLCIHKEAFMDMLKMSPI